MPTVAWTPPACRSAATRYSELNPVVTCYQVATPFIDLRAPSRHLPVSLPPSTPQILPARTESHRFVSQQPKSVRCLTAHEESRYPNSGLATPTGAHRTFLRPRRAVPRTPRPKTQTRAFPQLRPGFFHPGSTHRLRTYRALLPLEIGSAFPRPHPPMPLRTTLRRPDQLRRLDPSKEQPRTSEESRNLPSWRCFPLRLPFPQPRPSGFPASSPHALSRTGRNLNAGASGF